MGCRILLFQFLLELQNILNLTTREELRSWFLANASTETEMYLRVNRSWTPKENIILYVDAVEEALCFGWIDSTNRKIDDVAYSRFSPRRKNSNWTELNKARCRRLINLGLMTEAGMTVLPDLDINHFQIDDWILSQLQADAKAWKFLLACPQLFVRVRIDNIRFYEKMKRHEDAQRQLDKLISSAHDGIIYGEWNDRGRLDDNG